MEDLTGKTLLGNFYLESRKGSGKIAEVYKAWDKRKSVHVAVKVLRATSYKGQDFYQYFSREAELMAQLEHPNIVRFYEFCKDGSIVFIVMDWVDGANLKEVIIKRKAPLELPVAVSLLRPVASALQYAHSQKIIHCDVKPANILINQSNKVLLTDFGISKQVSQRTTGGTPPYMAPEQFTGDKLTPQTDVYGLGVTVYEMLSGGQVPYKGDSSQTRSTTLRERIHWEVMNVPYPELGQYNHSLPPGVEKAVKKALMRNPAMRYENTLDFSNALEQALDGSEKIAGVEALGLISAAREAEPVRGGINQRINPPTGPLGPQPTALQARILDQLPARFTGAFLFGLQGDLRGYFIPIEDANFTIGRAAQNMLTLSERSISRSHAAIRMAHNGAYIQDAGSKLGTIVNGQIVRDAMRLENGDVVQIGFEQVFEFHNR